MRHICNGCAETENGYAPCVYEMIIANELPKFCPISGDECDWDEFKSAAPIKEQPASSPETGRTTNARAEICSDNECDYCRLQDDDQACEASRMKAAETLDVEDCFIGRKLSPIA